MIEYWSAIKYRVSTNPHMVRKHPSRKDADHDVAFMKMLYKANVMKGITPLYIVVEREDA